MKDTVSYHRIGLVALFMWVASISTMELKRSDGSGSTDDDGFCQQVTLEEYNNLTQSMILAKEDGTPSLKDSSSWFSFSWSSISDRLWGVDANVASALKESNLTKEKVAQDKELQNRAEEAILAAIENKRTEKLCDLLNQLYKFDMLTTYKKHYPSISNFLNKEISVVCEKDSAKTLIDILEVMHYMRLTIDEPLFASINTVLHKEIKVNCVEKSCSKLLTVLRVMRNLELKVDNALHAEIKELLSQRQKQGVDEYNAGFTNMQLIIAKALDEMKKNKEHKDSFTETKNTVIELAYLNGQATPKPRDIKNILGITEQEKQFIAIIQAIKEFTGEK